MVPALGADKADVSISSPAIFTGDFTTTSFLISEFNFDGDRKIIFGNTRSGEGLVAVASSTTLTGSAAKLAEGLEPVNESFRVKIDEDNRLFVTTPVFPSKTRKIKSCSSLLKSSNPASCHDALIGLNSGLVKTNLSGFASCVATKHSGC